MTQQEEDLEALLALWEYGSLRRAGDIIGAHHQTVKERSERALRRLLESLPDSAPLKRATTAPNGPTKGDTIISHRQDFSAVDDEQAVNAV